ncbi:SDR family oxidoreductase [Streptomyces asiaticus]
MEFKDSRVVVIGGTSGLGFATASAAAREGASVVVASANRDRVDQALAQLPESADGHVVDASSEQSLRDFFAGLGAFDHLVYTAGEPLSVGALSDVDIDQARRFFEIRFWGALTAVKYAAGSIRPGGSVVLSSGSATARPQSGWSVTASALGAVEALTRALAVELAPLRVNAVAPGVVRTELWDGLPAEGRQALYDDTAAALPVGRVGEPADIAATHLYLMRNGFITGAVLPVDGGTRLA